VRIKENTRRRRPAPRLFQRDGARWVSEATVYRDLIAWSIRQYYGATS
jgi:hypothetical protein